MQYSALMLQVKELVERNLDISDIASRLCLSTETVQQVIAQLQNLI